MIGGIRFFLGIETRIEEDEEKEKEIKVDEIDQHAYPHTPPSPLATRTRRVPANATRSVKSPSVVGSCVARTR